MARNAGHQSHRLLQARSGDGPSHEKATNGRAHLVHRLLGATHSLADITAYTVSKAGVEMLARQMARESAENEIRVNVVAPGIVDAGLAKQQRVDDPKYAERIGKVIPLGTLQTVEQVAKVTAFLCTEDADYLTGMTLLADGGASLFQFDQT
jgi:NAD(P)-dependent dehydrogenase (short-subunit alcohol dehydrogenase family)